MSPSAVTSWGGKWPKLQVMFSAERGTVQAAPTADAAARSGQLLPLGAFRSGFVVLQECPVGFALSMSPERQQAVEIAACLL